MGNCHTNKGSNHKIKLCKRNFKCIHVIGKGGFGKVNISALFDFVR